MMIFVLQQAVELSLQLAQGMLIPLVRINLHLHLQRGPVLKLHPPSSITCANRK